MFRRILVPLDGSARAEAAIPVAARLARASAGTLIFVEVANIALDYGSMVGPMGPVPLSQEVIDRAYDETVAHLRALATRDDLAGIATETAVLSGPVAGVLLDAAQARHVDLIVLNSHGRSGLTRWTLGSVAEHVVHHASVPVLVLRELEFPSDNAPAAVGPSWRAVVGLDGSALAEAALGPAADLIRALAASGSGVLHLVRVVSPAPAPDDELSPLLGDAQALQQAHEAVRHDAEAYLRATAERMAGTGSEALRTSWEVSEAHDVATALIQAAERPAGTPIGAQQSAPTATVIAVATHGRGGIARWALGSVAERVIEGTRLPALVVRPAQVVAQQPVAGNQSDAP